MFFFLLAACAPEFSDDVSFLADPKDTGLGEDIDACDTTFVSRPVNYWRSNAAPYVVADANDPDISYALLPVTVGTSRTLSTPRELRMYLRQDSSGDAQLMLGQELVALKLNLAAMPWQSDNELGICTNERIEAVASQLEGMGDDTGSDGVTDILIVFGEVVESSDILYDEGSSSQQRNMARMLSMINRAGGDEALWFEGSSTMMGVDSDGDGVIDLECL